MSQKVKLQISSDLEDVPSLCSHTLEEAILNAEFLHSRINKAKQLLNGCSWNEQDKLNEVLEIFDSCRMLMSKLDSRLGDSSSIVYGLTEILNKKPNEEPKEETKDVSIVTG